MSPLRLTVPGTLLCALAPVLGAAQTPSLHTGPEVRITPPAMTRPLVEPMVAAHPRDPSRLVGLAIRTFHDRRWVPEQDCVSFRSDDGGRSWDVAPLPVPHFRCGDPWVAYGPDGAAWAVLLGLPTEDAQRSALHVLRLDPDARGHEWERVAVLPYGDHPTITVDTTSGPRRGTVYVVANRGRRLEWGPRHYGAVVWRLPQGAEEFEETVVSFAINLNVNPDNPVVLPGGRLLVPVDDFMRNVDDFRGEGWLEHSRTWLLASDDGGRTFLPPLMVSESCGRGFDILAVGTAEPEPHIFHVCLGQERRTVILHRSTDGGVRWAEPVELSDPGDVNSHRAAGMASNPAGDVVVAWQDRSVVDEPACQRLVAVASSDAGESFSDPAPLSSRTSCPENPRNQAAGERWEGGSDYGAVAAGADGRFHVVWADARDGAFVLYTVSVGFRSMDEDETP